MRKFDRRGEYTPLTLTPQAIALAVEPLTDAQIEHMAERFLMWKLPHPWHPDGGISFNPRKPINSGTPFENDLCPVGTNLFSYTQAEQMVHHMIEGLATTEQKHESISPALLRSLLRSEAEAVSGFAQAAAILSDIQDGREEARAILERTPMQTDNIPSEPVAWLVCHTSDGCFRQPDGTHVARCRCGFQTDAADSRLGAFDLWASHAIAASKDQTDAK